MKLYTIQLRDEDLIAGLAGLQSATADLRPAWRDVGEYMVEATKARFRNSRDPDGAPWAAKSPTTLDASEARGDGRPSKPLIGPTRRLSSEISYIASADGVSIGSSLIQAAVQQFGAAKGAFGATSRGAPIPWGAIPARPFLGIDRDDSRNILDIVEEHIGDAAAP